MITTNLIWIAYIKRETLSKRKWMIRTMNIYMEVKQPISYYYIVNYTYSYDYKHENVRRATTERKKEERHPHNDNNQRWVPIYNLYHVRIMNIVNIDIDYK